MERHGRPRPQIAVACKRSSMGLSGKHCGAEVDTKEARKGLARALGGSCPKQVPDFMMQESTFPGQQSRAAKQTFREACRRKRYL